jgi:hypothetical protein
VLVTAYRSAAYRTPVRDTPSTREGRFHNGTSPPTQYFCLHPLGPSSEEIRWDAGLTRAEELRDLKFRIWTVRVVVPDDILTLDYDNCDAHADVSPEELVGEDYGPTQASADRLRGRHVEAFICPSAAFPGTQSLVILAERVAISYLDTPVDVWEVSASMATSRGAPPTSLFPLVRRKGEPHAELDAFLRGNPFKFQEPSWIAEAP